MTEKRELPWWQKYTLTLNEASEYFGIGYKKLKLFVQEHSDADFVLWNGFPSILRGGAGHIDGRRNESLP